jgi:O-antigen ligase
LIASVSRLLDKILFVHVALLLFLTPLFLIPRLATYNPVVDSKKLVAFFLLCSFFLFYCLRILIFGIPQFRVTLVNVSAGLLTAAVIIACLASGNASYCFQEAWIPIFLLGLFFAVQPLLVGHRGIAKLQLVAILAAVVVSAYGLLQYFNLNVLADVFPYVRPSKESRNFILSTIGNPEYLGGYLAPFAVMMLPHLVVRRGAMVRVLAGLALLLFGFAMLLTGARGAWLGLLGGAMYIAYWMARRSAVRISARTGWLLAVVAGILVFLLVIFSFPNAINTRDARVIGRFAELADPRSESIKQRILFYAICAEMIGDRPVVGFGEGMFQIHFYDYIRRLVEKDERAGMTQFAIDLENRVAEHAHNDYLQFWVERGSVGLFLFVLLLLAYFLVVSRQLHTAGCGTAVWFLQLSLSGAIVCLLVSSAFSFPLHLPTRASLFWILLSMSTCLGHVASGNNTSGKGGQASHAKLAKG